MRVLVTGATGLIGQRVMRSFEQAGDEVTGIARRMQPSVDLTDASAVQRVVAHTKPQLVVHCAANSNVDACERSPDAAYADNVEATVHLAQACRSVGAFLVHLSTDYVFDGAAGPYETDAPPNPLSTYGRTKLAAELAVQTILPKDNWAIARTAVVYGAPGGVQNNFGLWLLAAFQADQPVPLFEDQWVTPSLAADVTTMVCEIGSRRLAGTWHAAGADSLTRLQFGYAFAECFGFDVSRIQPTRLAQAAVRRPTRAGLAMGRSANVLQFVPRSVNASLKAFQAEVLQVSAAATVHQQANADVSRPARS
jgi:dTDP-4-dehydrorhamnose reductase